MPRFRKKPVEVEAMQFRGLLPRILFDMSALDYAAEFDEWLDAKQGERKCRYVGQQLLIPTLEGDMMASPGDWIIQGVNGELYPRKPDIFAKTYEEVSDV